MISGKSGKHVVSVVVYIGNQRLDVVWIGVSIGEKLVVAKIVVNASPGDFVRNVFCGVGV
jgi:hypothetical protein